MKYLYHYEAEVLSVYDGDTCTLQIACGFDMFTRVTFRLTGIDTPEMKSKDATKKEAAVSARDHLRSRIMGKKVIVNTKEREKYGRWLGYLWVDEGGDELGESLNEEMIRLGHASPYEGGKKTL